MSQEQPSQDMFAQERLALDAERTLSAWLRTGLAAIVGGLGIIRFFVFKRPLHKFLAHSAGQMLLLWGIIVFIVAFREYRLVIATLSKQHIGSGLRITLLIVPLCLVALLLFLITILD